MIRRLEALSVLAGVICIAVALGHVDPYLGLAFVGIVLVGVGITFQE